MSSDRLEQQNIPVASSIAASFFRLWDRLRQKMETSMASMIVNTIIAIRTPIPAENAGSSNGFSL